MDQRFNYLKKKIKNKIKNKKKNMCPRVKGKGEEL
jgi:hypothetical protein